MLGQGKREDVRTKQRSHIRTPSGRVTADASTARAQRGHGERGASLVEFTLILPVFLLLIFGGITAAISYEHKSDIAHAVRDGSRYGATVPYAQCNTVANCGGRNWAQLVQYVTAQRSGGTLSASQICVALVAGTGSGGNPAPVATYLGGVYTTGTNATFPTVGCFDDGDGDTGTRVHVAAVKSGERINLVFGSIPVTLSSNGTSRYEQP